VFAGYFAQKHLCVLLSAAGPAHSFFQILCEFFHELRDDPESVSVRRISAAA